MVRWPKNCLMPASFWCTWLIRPSTLQHGRRRSNTGVVAAGVVQQHGVAAVGVALVD